MENKHSFIFYPEWLDLIDRLDGNKNDQYDLMKTIIDYGCGNEQACDNQVVSAIFDTLIKPRIDKAQENYQSKIDMGKSFGRPKALDDQVVRSMAKSGMKAKEIAKELNVSVDAVYHNSGWVNRNL